MLNFSRALIVAAALMALSGSALAQEIPCSKGPCVKASRPGTHFIVELNGGGTVYDGGGFAMEGILGVGGRLWQLPLRFYLLSEFAFNTSTESGTMSSVPLGYRDERAFRDLAVGLRIYVPVFTRMRIFGDIMGGGSHQTVTLKRDELPLRVASGWSGLSHVAVGFQYRVLYHLSLGFRTKVVLTSDDLAGLHAAVGNSSPVRTTITGGLTWHF